MLKSFLIGTYTKKTSKGIYEISLDTEKQELTNLKLLAEAGNPTYLGISNANNVYTVDKQGDQGGVTAFKLNNSTASMINSVMSPGSSPAYIGIDEQRQLVFSGNYHTGQIKVFSINEEGALSQTDSVTHQGLTGPAPEQDSPHVHFTDLTPDQRLAVCDLGMDITFVYDVSDSGSLTMISRYQSEPGFGSRHIVFHPSKPYAFLLGELSSQVEALRYDSKTANFTHVQTIKSIPDTWTDHNGAAAIHISNDGKYLYTSNRGFNSIAVFAIADDGSLSLIQNISTEGDFPRDFDFDNTEQYLVCVNQNTDNASLYQRDSDSGLLTLLQKDVFVPEGVCVKPYQQ